MPERSRAGRQLARFRVALDVSRLSLRGRARFALGFLAYTDVTDAVDLFTSGPVLFRSVLPMVFRTHVPFSIAISLRNARSAQGHTLIGLAGFIFVLLVVAIAVVFIRTASVILTGKLFEPR